MSKLFLPIGIPGCGKSTFASRVLMHNNLRVVETDAIREDLVKAGRLQSVNDMSRNKEVFAKFHAYIEDHLLDGFDVFADATNLTSSARHKLRQIADLRGAEIHLFIFTNLLAAVNRNRKRDRVVEPEPMVRLLGQYEKALQEIPQEIYASVTYIESFG